MKYFILAFVSFFAISNQSFAIGLYVDTCIVRVDSDELSLDSDEKDALFQSLLYKQWKILESKASPSHYSEMRLLSKKKENTSAADLSQSDILGLQFPVKLEVRTISAINKDAPEIITLVHVSELKTFDDLPSCVGGR